MPIKTCSKCGLKVYIDEAAKLVAPFLCSRCEATTKGTRRTANPAGGVGGSESRSVGASRELSNAQTLKPSDAPARPAASPAGLARLVCPACKSAFQTKLPSRPSRGSCPKCESELTISPDGRVRPAGLTERIAPPPHDTEPAAPAPAPLRKAAIPPSAPLPAPPDETSIEAPSSESDDVGPTLLEAGKPLAPRPEKTRVLGGDSVAADIRAAAEAEDELERISSSGPGEAKASRKPSLAERMAARKSGRGGLTSREGRSDAARPTGVGMILLGSILFLLPLGGAGALFAKRSQESIAGILTTTGELATRAAAAAQERFGSGRPRPAAPPPAVEPEPEPAPPAEPPPPEVKNDPQAKEEMGQAIQEKVMGLRRMEFRVKEMERAKRPDEEIREKKDEIAGMHAEIERMKSAYRKAFAEEFIEAQ